MTDVDSEPVSEADIDIPDEWRAFTLLVHAQAKHPLDFVREAVHNSLDAGATRVRVFVERGSKGNATAVKITDNGSGAPSAKSPDGAPPSASCLKRTLDTQTGATRGGPNSSTSPDTRPTL